MEKITFFNLLIYIDFKTAFEKLSTRGNIADISSTTEINKHTFCNFSIFIKFTLGKYKNNWCVYWRQDCKFLNEIKKNLYIKSIQLWN